MAVNTRSFGYTVELKSGLIIPASAGTGKLLTSDSEGKATWTAREKIISVDEHGWVLQGEVKEGVLPGFFVKVGTGNEKKLIGIEYKIEEGTEAEFEVRRIKKEEASEALTGFTALKAKSNKIERATPTAITLATEDFIYLKIIKISGTPKNFSATGFVERIVS